MHRTATTDFSNSEGYDVFISYGSADRKYRFKNGRTIDVIATFKRLLEDHRHPDLPQKRFRVCTDSEDFDLEATISGAICKKLQQSDVLLVFCCPSASESPYVAAELEYFAKTVQGEIIPANYLLTPNESFPRLFGLDVLGVNLEPTTNIREWRKRAREESHKLAARVWSLPSQQTYNRFVASDRRRFQKRILILLSFLFLVIIASAVVLNEGHKRRLKSQIEERVSLLGGVIEISPKGGRIVNLSQADDVSDSDLESLSYLGKVIEVNLPIKNGVSDVGITFLKELRNLESLYLDAPAITGIGLQSIRKLRKLRNLSFSGSSFVRHDLKVLSKFPHLQYLSLYRCDLDNLDMEYVGQRLKLENLNLGYTNVGDSALFHLRNLKKIKYLNLSGTLVTNVGLAQLASLQHLQDLSLFFTSIGDDGVDDLLKLEGLKNIRIGDTSISPKGVFRLIDLPNLDFVALCDDQFPQEYNKIRTMLEKNGIELWLADCESFG